jgi:hypothetical protein
MQNTSHIQNATEKYMEITNTIESSDLYLINDV